MPSSGTGQRARSLTASELRLGQCAARPGRVAVPMSASDVYSARGFGGRQGAGERPAVVVVDFIQGFTDPASPLACDADAAVEATRSLLDAAACRVRRPCSSPPFATPTRTWSARRCSSRRRPRSPRYAPAPAGSRSTRASGVARRSRLSSSSSLRPSSARALDELLRAKELRHGCRRRRLDLGLRPGDGR